MPILRYTPLDPTDRVLAGEQLRASVADEPVVLQIGACLGGGLMPLSFASVLYDDDRFEPMNSFIYTNRLSMRRSNNGALQMFEGAGIATPCGAWLPFDRNPIVNPLTWASTLWAMVGVTNDSTGAALGGCRVVAIEAGRIGADNIEASKSETISDGSGNYSLPVPTNTAYLLIAYKVGAPDVGGVTRADVTPTAVG